MLKREIAFILIILLIFTIPVNAFSFQDFFNKIFGIFLQQPSQSQGEHPKLLFTQDEVPALQAKVLDGGRDDEIFLDVIEHSNSILNSPPSNILDHVRTLAISYHLSDDNSPNKYLYRDKCKDIVMYLVENYDSRGDTFEATKRLYSLTVGYDMCYDSFNTTEKALTIAEIEEYLSWMTGGWPDPWNPLYNQFLSPPLTYNKGIMAGSTLGLGSIVLRGDSNNDALLDDALEMSDAILNLNLNYPFGEDGAYTEGTLYVAWSMLFFSPYIEARKRYDGVDYGSFDQIRNIKEWLVYGIKPGPAYVENINDVSARNWPLTIYNTYLDWAQTAYNSSLIKWVSEKHIYAEDWNNQEDRMATVLWNKNIVPADPNEVLENSKIFKHRGLYYYRTGWDTVQQNFTNDTVFSLYSGKFWGGHAQEDQGQFTLWSKGVEFIRDNGINTCVNCIQARDTPSHNLIVIDGQQQHFAGSIVGTDGNISSYLISSFADYLHTDNTNAYNTHSEFNDNDTPYYHGPEPDPILNSKRYSLIVKKGDNSEYFVIFDDINKDNQLHSYDLYIHTNTDNLYEYTSNPVIINNTYNSLQGPILDIFFVNPEFNDITFSDIIYQVLGEDGFSRRLNVSTQAINPNFFYVLFPRDSGQQNILYNKLDPTFGKGVEINFTDYSDKIFYKDGIQNLAYNDLETDSKVSMLRDNFNLIPNNFLVGDGSYINNIVPLVKVFNGTSSVSSNGYEISISDPSLSYMVYGPNVNTVTYEGNEISFIKDGQYILVNYLLFDRFPTVTLDSPINGTTNYPNVTFTCSATDDNNVESMILYINIDGWQAISASNGNSLSYNTNLLEGSYEWNCLAYDNNGNPSFAPNNNYLEIVPLICIDNDSDGYGVCPNCDVLNGCLYDGDDCNDNDTLINPGMVELCGDGKDNNCNGIIDEYCAPIRQERANTWIKGGNNDPNWQGALLNNTRIINSNILISFSSLVGYYLNGRVTSEVFDTRLNNVNWKNLSWDKDTPINTTINFEVRASNNLFTQTSNNPIWIQYNGTLPKGRYIQWRSTLSTLDVSYTPILYNVTATYLEQKIDNGESEIIEDEQEKGNKKYSPFNSIWIYIKSLLGI